MEADIMGSIGLPELVIVCVIFLGALLVVWPTARICRRLGFSRWLGLFAAIPIANWLLLWFLALAQWPASNSTQDSA
jgi:hypothetical protein